VTIPYFDQPSLGPFHAFGALVAAAVLVGTSVLQKRATHERLDAELASRLVFWVLVGGFITAHLVHCFVYFPEETLENPISILKIWDGISSFGGFLGAVGAIIAFSRRAEWQALSSPARWRYVDVVAYAFVFGWIFGRAGCTVAYDHPGDPTTFFLGWEYKDHVVRHNLGFYEMLYFIPLAGLYGLLGRTPRRFGPGFFTGLIAVLYAPVRFSFDYLRIVDVRYAGLTPGQWGSIAVALAGLYVIWRAKQLEAVEAELEAQAAAAPAPKAAARGGAKKGKRK
jgi:phosphatidylglycerol:prolipoprotein diacylglycerol transferase